MFRNYCFTLNNYTNDEINGLVECGRYNYLIYGKEEGEGGTPHLQGYMELTNPMRITTLKNINERIHWESRKGTQEQAITYCKKDDNWTEHGTKKSQGQRNDLDRVRQNALDEGMRWVTSYCNAQQIKVAESFLTYNEEPRDWKPTIIWIWGPTGTGKSMRAREITENAYTKSDGTKWWPGYDGHEHLIIDDFRDSWWTITEMLSLLDRYEKRIEFKGGYRQLKARLIVITSCKSPNECYKNTGESIDQLTRRIDHTIELTSVTDVTEVGRG